MITLIAFHEDQWFTHDKGADEAQWRHLARAFLADHQLIDRWDQAVIPPGADVVLIDQAGDEPVRLLRHDRDLCLVFGKTGQHLPDVVGRYDRCMRYDAPDPNIGMFGITVAGAVLHQLVVAP